MTKDESFPKLVEMNHSKMAKENLLQLRIMWSGQHMCTRQTGDFFKVEGSQINTTRRSRPSDIQKNPNIWRTNDCQMSA